MKLKFFYKDYFRRNKGCFTEILIKTEQIDSFHIVSAHAPNSLVPRYLREITLQGATFIWLPMHYTMEYEKRWKEKEIRK